MKKLKLEPETLVVESFSPAAPDRGRGTVQAHATLRMCNSGPDQTCGPYFTCNYLSCDNVCGTYYCTDESCFATCYGDCTNSCDNTCNQTCFTCNTCPGMMTC